MQGTATVPSVTEIESSLLGVLLSIDTARKGAQDVLNILAPALDDRSAAVALRDRDGVTLHVVAEIGDLATWPERLEPQLAISEYPGIDRETGVMVIPLRARGRNIGTLMLADPSAARQILHSEAMPQLLGVASEVLYAVVERLDAEVERRALAARSLTAILDSMGHQLTNPLTGASAIAQLLLEDLQDEEQKASVRQLRQELSRAFVIIHDLLDFHRDTHAQDGYLDLNALVERVVRFRGYAIREQGISLHFEPAENYLPVRADVRGLEHALLLALRFAESRSHASTNRAIAVSVVERDSDQCVEITDSGAGDLPDASPRYLDLPLGHSGALLRDQMAEADLGLLASILGGCGGRLEIRASKTSGTTLSLLLPRVHAGPQQTHKGRKAV